MAVAEVGTTTGSRPYKEVIVAEAVDSAVRAGSLQASATERIDLVFWFAFGALDRHLVAETVPDREEVRRVTAFCLGGHGVTPAE